MGGLRFTLKMAALAVAFACLVPGRASAQGGPPGVRFDLHGSFGWYADFGLGFRVDIPIVPDGILDGVNDDLALSLGAEALYFYHPNATGIGVWPLLLMQWNFYLNDRWSIFPEVGLAFLFGPDRNRYWQTFAAPIGMFGVRYRFSTRNALLLRVGWPAGAQIGITF